MLFVCHIEISLSPPISKSNISHKLSLKITKSFSINPTHGYGGLSNNIKEHASISLIYLSFILFGFQY
jgi:hypothetical protein